MQDSKSLRVQNLITEDIIMRIGLIGLSSAPGPFRPAAALASSLASLGGRVAVIAITAPEQAAAAWEVFGCHGSRWSLHDLSSGACNAGQALMPTGFSPAVDVMVEPSVTAMAVPEAAAARVLDRVSVTHEHVVIICDCDCDGWPRDARGWLTNMDHNLMLCPTRLPEIRALLADGSWPPAGTAAFQLWAERTGHDAAGAEHPTPQALAQLLGIPLFGVFEAETLSTPGQAAELKAAVQRLQQATVAPAERQQQLKARLADTLLRDRTAMRQTPAAAASQAHPNTPAGERAATPEEAPGTDADAPSPTSATPEPVTYAMNGAGEVAVPSLPDNSASSAPSQTAAGHSLAGSAGGAPPRSDTEATTAAVLSITSALSEIDQLRQRLADRMAECQASCRQRAEELQVYLARFVPGSSEAAAAYDSGFPGESEGRADLPPDFDPAAAAADLHAMDQQARQLGERLTEIDGQTQELADLVTNWLHELKLN